MLGSLFGAAGGGLALLLGALLNRDAIGFGLGPGALGLLGLQFQLQLAAVGGGLGFELAALGGFALGLSLLLGFNPGALGGFPSDALFALFLLAGFSLGAQADQFGLFRFVLLAGGEGGAQQLQRIVLGPGSFGFKLLPLFAQGDGLNLGDAISQIFGGNAFQRFGVELQVGNGVVVSVYPSILGCLPVVQRLTYLVAQSVCLFHELSQFCLNNLWQFFDLAEIVTPRLLDSRLSLAHCRCQASDAFSTLACGEVWNLAADLILDHLQKRLEAVLDIDDWGGFFADVVDGDQLRLCGHTNLPRHPCGGR
ncbi:hypothetical protein D3C77_474890 [compost metagenome]